MGTLAPLLLRSAGAAAIGVLAWSADANAFALLPLLVWIWRDSRNRWEAFAALFLYYLGAGRGLLSGASVFFADPFATPSWWAGVLIWILPSALLATTWATTWGTTRRGLRIVLMLVLISLPPIGLVGWANPLTAAGALFPGIGWYGLALMLSFIVAIAVNPRPRALLPFLAVSAALNFAIPAPADTAGWMGIDTRYGATHSTEEEFERLNGLRKRIMEASRSAPDGTVFVLPEAVGGDWTVNSAWWRQVAAQLQIRRQTVLIGAKRPDSDSRQYVNMLTTVGHDAGIEFPGRVPVPVSMWRPDRNDGAKAAWWNSGVAVLNSTKVAMLVCYEQLLVWPVLVSMSESPDVLIGASNHWWARGTSIPAIQRNAVSTWGRLFRIPTVYAANL